MIAQAAALIIFVGMFVLIILDKFERYYITLASGALVLALVFGVCMHSMSAIWGTLNLPSIFTSGFWYGASEEGNSGINWSTIFVIAGMMIMVEGLGKAGFFRWLCLTLAKLVRRINRQTQFVLAGPEYARSKGEVSELLRPWYQKKSVNLQHELPPDERIFSPELAQDMIEGFEELMPFYKYFDRLCAAQTEK